MAATFSWAQFTGSSGNTTTPGTAVGLTPTSSSNSMSWDFETADNTGTTSYTANPVSAGSASYPMWLKGYFTNSVAYTVSNIKFWQFTPAASSANTASFTVFGTVQTAYAQATGTATGANYASNVAVPLGTASTASPAGALGTHTAAASNFGTFGTTATAGGSGYMPNYVAMQLSATSAAPAGTSGYFGFTLQYDEQ